MQKINRESRSCEASSDVGSKEKGPSKMAEMIALHRVVESRFPEGQRICYDPYAVYFIDPKTLELAAKNPEKVKEMKEHYESLFPGLGNSIRARVRYFDDFVKSEVDKGIEQLVILGAGYDTRAYRIKGLERIRVFEVDHPATQVIKQEKIKSIFGQIPKNVAYVPADLSVNSLEKMHSEKGYDPTKRTLFVMEGVIMYIPAKAVDDLLSFIVRRSGKGSKIIFDYYPQSLVDGTSNLQAATNVRRYVEEQGEPLLFGIEEGEAEAFLSERGFSHIADVSSKDYHKAYFLGANRDRIVSSLLYFAHAAIM